MVAQQILSILSALAASLTRFYFEGFEINLVWSCGIFITMNPGTGGGRECPGQRAVRPLPLPGQRVQPKGEAVKAAQQEGINIRLCGRRGSSLPVTLRGQ